MKIYFCNQCQQWCIDEDLSAFWSKAQERFYIQCKPCKRARQNKRYYSDLDNSRKIGREKQRRYYASNSERGLSGIVEVAREVNLA